MTPDPTDPKAAPPLKKKRGAPDPDVEVIALSPGTLQAATRFACEACGKEFPREQNLRLHHRSHNLPWRPRPEAAPQRRRKVYVCPEPGCVHHSLECAFGDLATIKKHFCRKHGEKRWACKRCGKRYAVELDLKAHAKANTCGTREHTRFTRKSVPAPQSPDLEAQENVDKDKEKGEEETEQPPSGDEEEVTEKVPSPPTLPQEPSTPCALQATGEKGEEETEQPPSGKEAAVTEKVPSPPTLPQEPSTTCALQATGASRGARGSMEERRKPYLVSVPRRRSRRSIISSTLISHPSAPASVSGSPATSAQQPASMASTGTVAPVVTDLVDFLNASPTSFHAVDEAKRRLKVAGYAQLSEREEWTGLELGRKYFFTHNHSTIFAFAIGVKYVAGNGFHIIGAHIDSPCLKLKPVSKVTKGGNLEVGVQTYGSGLWYTWFDCDLTVAGMVIVKEKKEGSISYAHKLVRVQEPIMRIPTFAVHLDRTISSEGLKINNQSHLVPVLTTCIKNEIKKLVGENGPEESSENKNMKHHPLLLQLIAKEANCEPDDISDFELQVCDTQPSIVAGAMKEFIFSGRLDNLCMSFCSLKALIDSDHSLDHESGVRMVALFDHEEVGSNSAQGAGSPAMLDALSRITASFNTSNSKLLEKAIQRSFLVSADMAHALHPNYMDKHEENHQPKMHGGLVIKDNANQRYATNAFIFREIAERHQLPVQDLVARNDMDFGSTIGLILASGIGIRTVDIGAPLLSMHSIREMCAVDDINHLYEHFKAYFEEFTELDSKAKVDDC